MVLYRTVFQAQFGKANELVAALRAMNEGMSEEQMKTLQPRVLTDISGPFDTVVVETTHESLAALEQFRKELFASDEPAGDSPIAGLIASGRNEYYTIEL